MEGAQSGNDIWKIRDLNIKVGDIYKLPFKDKSYDTVYSSHVLEHCEDPDKVLLETVRVAKKVFMLCLMVMLMKKTLEVNIFISLIRKKLC